ncbi:UNVERIFIED_CONTAM: hypothetical protein Sradi_3795000 [Sesamum radiatum]|uniref:Zinc finger PMZ-type domain-containing protein n=1 Tax=Sesamum radiatum TaxID=300843 RepID=A0AAW2Q072_SESRA
MHSCARTYDDSLAKVKYLSMRIEDAIRDNPNIPVDRQKGLLDALRELAAGSEHRFCVRHLYENFKAKFKGAELKEYLWKAATTANKQEFRVRMKKIAKLDPKKSRDYETTAEWLSKIPAEHWSRAFFPVKSKCDILVKNLCESFNNFILYTRDKPIINHFLHKYVADLDKKTCTCGMFELTGYPYCHAYSAIADMGHEVEDYVDACYKKPVYLKAY